MTRPSAHRGTVGGVSRRCPDRPKNAAGAYLSVRSRQDQRQGQRDGSGPVVRLLELRWLGAGELIRPQDGHLRKMLEGKEIHDKMGARVASLRVANPRWRIHNNFRHSVIRFTVLNGAPLVPLLGGVA
jgi:hypothetical protein